MSRHRIASLCTLLLVIAMAGCKQPLPPPTPVPPAPSATGYGDLPPATASVKDVPGGAAQRFLTDLDVPGQWWTLFHSDELNALVDEGLRANPDIPAAQAALRSAREALDAQRASAYPNAQGSFSVARQQVPTYYAPPLTSNASEYVYGVHTASLDVAYTPDVFGNLRYQTQTAAAAAAVQRYDVEATYLTLTSNIATTAFAVASVRAQIDVTNRILGIERDLLDLTKTTRAYAQAAGLDVLTQEATLRATEQTLPGLDKQLAQLRDSLARLVGRAPSDAPVAAFDLASLHLPEDLPVSLPSKLLVQRPDIAAAEFLDHRADRDAGAQSGQPVRTGHPAFDADRRGLDDVLRPRHPQASRSLRDRRLRPSRGHLHGNGAERTSERRRFASGAANRRGCPAAGEAIG